LSVYSLGIYIGSGLALIVGGAVINAVSATPDCRFTDTRCHVVLAFDVLDRWTAGRVSRTFVYTVRDTSADGSSESSRKSECASGHSRDDQLQLGRAMAIGGGNLPGTRHTGTTCFYAQQAWLPTLMIRVHKWNPGKTGLVLGTHHDDDGMRWSAAGREALRSLVAARYTGCSASVGTHHHDSCRRHLLHLSQLVESTLGNGSARAGAPPAGNACRQCLRSHAPDHAQRIAGTLIFAGFFSTSVGGLMLGPFLIGFSNDYIFQSPKFDRLLPGTHDWHRRHRIGIDFFATLRSYRRHHALLHGPVPEP
jgi:hypothetical protein